MKHRSWIVFSGYVWFFIGAMLLYKGLKFISEALLRKDSICFKFSKTLGSPEKAATVLIAVALLVGFIKGRFVLAKTVRRVVLRIVNLSEPIRFKDAYSSSYWMVMAFMMFLAMSMKYLPISIEIRGMIDVAVGSALINGAILYFRAARAINLSA